MVAKMGRSTNFLIGAGNDGNQYTTDFANYGVTMDIHYLYLTGGWPGWAGAGYVTAIIDTAYSKGTTPMITYYGFNDDAVNQLGNTSYVQTFWQENDTLLNAIAGTGKVVLVQYHPDFWMYIQNRSGGNTGYAAPVKINSRCSDLPDTIAGFGSCLIRSARQIAPKTLIAFHASAWNGWGSGADVSKFLMGCGAGETDFVVVETLDRDAGCFEAKYQSDARCAGGCTNCYWSDSQYNTYLYWVKAVTKGVGLPALWWQMPYGVPSSTPGGTPDHWRDNKVQYFFAHVQQLIDAGGFGAAFGTGAGAQTSPYTDNNQFRNAVGAYFQNPVALP
jgi:hypothetical protein